MKMLTRGLAVLFLVFAGGIAYAPPPPPQPGPVVKPVQPGEDFEKVTDGNVTVFYKEGWKGAAEKTAKLVSMVIKDTLQKAGLEYSGVCEVTLRPLAPADLAAAMPAPMFDARANSVRFPIAVPQGGADQFSLKDLQTQQALSSVFNYAINLQILASQPDAATSNPRWFMQGLAAYLHTHAAKEIAGDDWRKLPQTQMQFSDKMLEHYRDRLLGWTSKQRSRADGIYTPACARIFFEIEKKFGADAVRKIGEGYAKAEKVDKDSLVKIISDAIGEDLIEFLKKYESPDKYPTLGVITDPEFKEKGIRVKDVQADSAASEAGIEAEDVIIRAGGKEIKDLAALKEVIDHVGVGGKLEMVVRRGEQEVELTATLKERAFDFPPAPGSSPPPTPRPVPEPEPKPEPKDLSEAQKKDALKAAGFSNAQIALFFEYFEQAASDEAANLDQKTKKRIVAFLEKAGFTPLQIGVLLSIFRLKPETVKALPPVEANGEKPGDGEKSAVEMLVERGCPKVMAEFMVKTYKEKMGKTEEEIKQMIRDGKINIPQPQK